MTEKELHKLRREDLLQLLLSQSRELERLQRECEGMREGRNEAVESLNRLKARLNEKDAQLDRLKEKLNEKDETIERLKARLDNKDDVINRLRSASRLVFNPDGTMGFRLDDIFEAAREAAENYVKNALAEEHAAADVKELFTMQEEHYYIKKVLDPLDG